MMNRRGPCCSFPFVYRDALYDACILHPDGVRRWCAITPNYDEHRAWGFCAGPEQVQVLTFPALLMADNVIGMVWYHIVWHGMVWYSIRFGVVWYLIVWHGIECFGIVWFGVVWLAVIR